MLDFYFIPDDQPKPNNPDETNFAGNLDDKTYYNLQKKGIIDERFDFYSDFRWSKVLLQQIYERIEKKQLFSDTDVQQLLHMVDSAIERKCGLMAYGD